MSTYEERAVHALETASSSMPVALKGIGWALLALGGKAGQRDSEYRYGAQQCKFCRDSYADLTDHYITTTKECGRSLAAMLIKAHGRPAS